MRSVKDFRSKVIIIWHQVKRKLFLAYVFIVKTFDFGQIYVKGELELILSLVCLWYRQPDYFNRKHIFIFRIAYSQAQSFHFKHCSLIQQILHLSENLNYLVHHRESGTKRKRVLSKKVEVTNPWHIRPSLRSLQQIKILEFRKTLKSQIENSSGCGHYNSPRGNSRAVKQASRSKNWSLGHFMLSLRAAL